MATDIEQRTFQTASSLALEAAGSILALPGVAPGGEAMRQSTIQQIIHRAIVRYQQGIASCSNR
jgi:hypothetical protein